MTDAMKEANAMKELLAENSSHQWFRIIPYLYTHHYVLEPDAYWTHIDIHL